MITLPKPPALHPKLKNYCAWIQNKTLNSDSMVLGIVCGMPGTGKSVYAQKICYHVGGMMQIDQIAFTLDEFIKAICKYKRNRVLADEGVSIFFGRAAMSKRGRLAAEMVNQIRQQNDLVIICVPFAETLDTMIQKMTSFIIEVYETTRVIDGREITIKGNVRGYFKHKHFDKPKAFYAYRRAMDKPIKNKPKRPTPDFTQEGEIYNPDKPPFYAVDRKLYLEKKNNILKKYQPGYNPRTGKIIDYEKIDALIKAGEKTAIEIAFEAGVSQKTIDNRRAILRVSNRSSMT